MKLLSLEDTGMLEWYANSLRPCSHTTLRSTYRISSGATSVHKSDSALNIWFSGHKAFLLKFMSPFSSSKSRYAANPLEREGCLWDS